MAGIKANFDPTKGFYQTRQTGSTPPDFFFEVSGTVVFKERVTFMSGASGISGSGGGAVDSVFGRTGTVAAAANDYNATQISHSAFGQITGSTVALAIQGLRNFAANQTGSVTSVFGRSGAIVAAANDYNATQVSHSAFGTLTGSTVALALQGLQNYITIVSASSGGEPYLPPEMLALTGFVASATAGNRRGFVATSNTVARGASDFSVSILFNVNNPSAPEGQTLASCWDGTNGWYIEVEGRVIRFVVTTAGGTRTAEKQMEAPFYSKSVVITGTYTGTGTTAFISLFVNNYAYVNTFTNATDGTFVEANGSNMFTIGSRNSGASNGAVNCRIAGLAYYTRQLSEADVALTFEDFRDGGRITSAGSPQNFWTIQSDYPTTTWDDTIGDTTLDALNSTALSTFAGTHYWL